MHDSPAHHRAAAYVRFSSYDQPCQPLPKQRLLCHVFAKANHLTLVSVYAEPGDSADQPALRQLIDDSSTGAFAQLIVFSTKTLARDPYALALCHEHLARRGIQIRPIVRFAPKEAEQQILQAFLLGRAGTTKDVLDSLWPDEPSLPAATSTFPFPLEGKLICDRCAAPMVGAIRHGRPVYACTNTFCDKADEGAAALDIFLSEKALNLLLTPFNISTLSHSTAALHRRVFGTESLHTLEHHIPILRKNALRETQRNPDSTRTARAMSMLADAEQDLHRLHLGHAIPCPPKAVRTWLSSLHEADRRDAHTRRYILDSFVRVAYIGDRHITVLLNASLPNRADGMMDNPLPKPFGTKSDIRLY